MKTFLSLGIFILFSGVISPAQVLTEQVIEWNSDGYQTSKCHVTLYKADEIETRGKTHIVVLRELAENTGRTTLDDAKYLAEYVTARFSLELEQVLFIHYVGAFSFGDGKGRKAILMATSFKKQENGRLTSPSWRLSSFEDLANYTDRQFKLLTVAH